MPAYQDGREIEVGDIVLLHNDPAEIVLVLDGKTNPQDWPAQVYGRGVLIAEPKVFGHLFLTEDDLRSYEDLTFVSRSSKPGHDDSPA
jgi:hypothetical protein